MNPYSCKPYMDGLLQERRNSIANALELHLSCINPSISFSSFTPSWLCVFAGTGGAGCVGAATMAGDATEGPACSPAARRTATYTGWGGWLRLSNDTNSDTGTLLGELGCGLIKLHLSGMCDDESTMVQVKAWVSSGGEPLAEPKLLTR